MVFLCFFFKYIYTFTCNTDSLMVEFTYKMLAMVIRHGYALTAEGIGRDDVSPCLQIATVNVLYDVRTGKAEDVIVAHHLPWNITEPIPTEISFSEIVALYHGAHGTVQ